MPVFRFAYNKSKNSEGSEQAGLIFGFGLNGILKHMPATLRHDHLAKENSFTTMAMLIGLASNLIGNRARCIKLNKQIFHI